MGVFRSSSCLITSSKPGAGLRGSSDGRVADRGVLSSLSRADRGCLNSLSKADRGVVSSLGRADRGVLSSEARADRGVLSSLGRADLGASGRRRLGVLRAGNTGFADAEDMVDGLKVGTILRMHETAREVEPSDPKGPGGCRW